MKIVFVIVVIDLLRILKLLMLVVLVRKLLMLLSLFFSVIISVVFSNGFDRILRLFISVIRMIELDID